MWHSFLPTLMLIPLYSEAMLSSCSIRASRECDHVFPYADSYEALRNMPIATDATAVTSQTTGETLICFFKNVLAIGMGSTQLNQSLINPNQLRNHGILVQDNPCYADASMHLTCLSWWWIHHPDASWRNHNILWWTETDQLRAGKLSSYHLTIVSFTMESMGSAVSTSAHHVDEGYPLKLMVCWCKASTYLVPIAKLILDWHISEVSVLVGDQAPDIPIPRTFLSNKRHSGVLAEGLSETRWYIGLEQGHETIKVTMQNCTLSAVLPFSRW